MYYKCESEGKLKGNSVSAKEGEERVVERRAATQHNTNFDRVINFIIVTE